MKILHGVIEIAGQMGILCGALRRKGHLSTGYNFFHSYLGYKDHLVNTTADRLQVMSNFLIHYFQLFHFHYASSLLPNFADLPKIQSMGKKMIMHHWGNDVRFHEQARLHNPYVYTGDSPPNEVMQKKLVKISTHISESIVQDYEVLSYVAPYYKKVHVLPIAINEKKFPASFPSIEKKKPLILHAPTNPSFKGTVHIENAIHQLQGKYDFDYVRIEKMSNEKAIEMYRKADIIVDQILCGSYGLLCVEAMTLGKPVVAYLRKDLIPLFPEKPPIVNANPDTVYQQVKMLLDHPELRVERGVQGREYALKYHASDRVVDKLLSIYKQIEVKK